MDPKRVEALSERVERLERRLRRWRALGVAAICAFGLAAFFGIPSSRDAGAEESQTKEYNITVPPEVFQMGQPQLVGELRAQRIVLVDAKGEPRGSLHVTETGTPSLELYGRTGRTQVSLAVKGSGSPRLVLYDRVGRVIWRAP